MPMASAARLSTTSTLRSTRGFRLEDHRGAVGDDFAHGLADLRGIETHHDDAIRAHDGGILDEAIDGVPAGLFKQLRVFVDLTAHNRAQPRHDVAAQSP